MYFLSHSHETLSDVSCTKSISSCLAGDGGLPFCSCQAGHSRQGLKLVQNNLAYYCGLYYNHFFFLSPCLPVSFLSPQASWEVCFRGPGGRQSKWKKPPTTSKCNQVNKMYLWWYNTLLFFFNIKGIIIFNKNWVQQLKSFKVASFVLWSDGHSKG